MDEGRTGRYYFRRLGNRLGRRNVQLNITRYRSWRNVGLQTWPANLKSGVRKRSLNFVVGYVSWEVPDGPR